MINLDIALNASEVRETLQDWIDRVDWEGYDFEQTVMIQTKEEELAIEWLEYLREMEDTWGVFE